jgi:hypothetical protein
MARFQLYQSLEYVTHDFSQMFFTDDIEDTGIFVRERGREREREIERERDPNSDVYGGNRWNQMNKSTCFSCLPVSTR